MIAVNAVGDSLLSDSFSYIAADVPGIPGTPYQTATTVTQIDIAWTESDNNGSPVTRYDIFASENLGPYTLVGTSVSNSYVAAGLSMGNNYKFRVIAINAAG